MSQQPLVGSHDGDSGTVSVSFFYVNTAEVLSKTMQISHVRINVTHFQVGLRDI